MKKYLMLIALALSLAGTSQLSCRRMFFSALNGQPESESISDMTYCDLDNGFFDQTEVTQQEVFKNASPEEQKNMLEALFKSKLRAAHFMDSVRNNGWQVTLMATAILYYMYQRFFVARLQNPAQPMANQPQANAGMNMPQQVGWIGGFLASAPIAWSLADSFQSALEAAVNWLFKKEKIHELFAYEREYVRNKPIIDKRLHKGLEDAFMSAHCGGLASGDAVKYAKLALAVPDTVKAIDCDEKRFEQIEQQIAHRYSGDVLKSLMSYAVRLTAASQSTDFQKKALYLYGPPGTGKTTGVERIAQGLDMVCEKLSLGQVGSVYDLLGSGYGDGGAKSGLLLEALTKNSDKKDGGKGGKKPKNIIILLDDADRVLNDDKSGGLLQSLLTLLEPETKTFYSPYLQADVDISHVNFILTGNSAIKDEALRNRFECVEFAAYDAKYKSKVVWDELLPAAIAMHKNDPFAFYLADITAEDRRHIDELVKRDKDGGFRTIKGEVMKFVDNKILCRRGPRYCKKEAPAFCPAQKRDMALKLMTVFKAGAVCDVSATPNQ